MSGQPNTIAINAWKGMISFQSNNMLDVFQVVEVVESGVRLLDESLSMIEDTQFESDHAWITGCVPALIPVNVDGDTTVINAWFQADSFEKNFTLRIYVEFEEAEAVVSGTDTGEHRCEQPKEIFL